MIGKQRSTSETRTKLLDDDMNATYSLVWILLRLVVAVLLLIASVAAASALATGTIWHGLLLVLHRPANLVWLLLLLTITTLVVISVTPWLVLGVLLLILIPASASGCPLITALSVATTVIVASTTLVATSTPAVPILVVLDSLRVLSYHSRNNAPC